MAINYNCVLLTRKLMWAIAKLSLNIIIVYSHTIHDQMVNKCNTIIREKINASNKLLQPEICKSCDKKIGQRIYL